MNVKSIHSFIFVFLAAITANMAHVVIVHEDEACEICLHIQSNDDGITPSTDSNLPEFDTLPTTLGILSATLVSYQSINPDPIRGPPLIS